MGTQTIDKIRGVLARISAVERDLLAIRDDLTSLLFGTHAADGNEIDSEDSAQESVAQQEPSRAAQDSTVDSEAPSNLESWLNSRDIRIKQRPAEIELGPSFDRFAQFLGDRFDSLRSFYAAVKQRIGGSPYPKTVSLKNLVPQQIADVAQFGYDLKRNSFLGDFRYDKKQKLVFFEPQNHGLVTNFFTGGWLERYVLLKTKEYLSRITNASEVEILKNPQIVLPDGSDFELDLLIGASSIVLWLECKTGSNYPEYVARYGQIAKKYMRIPPTHCALVLLEALTDEEKRNNSHLASMSVINLPDVDSFLARIGSGAKDLMDVPVVPVAAPFSFEASGTPGTPQHIAALNRVNLRPLNPSDRRRIINDMREQAVTHTTPVPLQELVRKVKERYNIAGMTTSKSQISDVSSALRRAGICHRGSHPDYEHDVWFLRTDLTAEEMFETCTQVYFWSLLKEPYLQAARATNAQTVATILWGDEMSPEDAVHHVESLVEELIKMGKCVREEVGGIPNVRAVGESFLEQN
jgi:hypothetical protein